MFELFQYTACRLLPLDRCKLESARVTRLMESAARAIVPPIPFRSRLLGADHNIPAVGLRPLIKVPTSRLNQGDFWMVFNSNPIAMRALWAPSFLTFFTFAHFCENRTSGSSWIRQRGRPHSLSSSGRCLLLWLCFERFAWTCRSSHHHHHLPPPPQQQQTHTLRTRRYKPAL